MSGDPLRTFFAVDLPPSVRAEAVRRVAPVRSVVTKGVRWVAEENLHLTLRFLGNLPPEHIPKLVSFAEATLLPLPQFEATIGGLGAFPNADRARVLWLDVMRGARELARLARKLDGAAAKIGIERERRPYRAHLTVGRLRQPASVPLARIAAPSGSKEISFSVEEVVLYESRLSSAGARYIPLARLPLGKVGALQHELAP
jgi:2'-5' RNA ligase